MPPLPPSWDGFHPLFVHFPVALLVVAPLFVLLAGLTSKRVFMISALLLMLMGVAGSFLATNTGEEAYAVMDPNYELEPEDEPWSADPYDVAEEHGELAEFARNVFVVATAAYLVVVVVVFAKPSTNKIIPRLLTHAAVIGLLAWANLEMANAAHLGGELVHRYGVRAVVATSEADAEDEAAEEAASEEPEAQPDETDESAGEAEAEEPAA